MKKRGYNISQREIGNKNIIFVLLIVGIISLVIRLYYTPFEIPITLDGLSYFWYALDMSIVGKFPEGYNFPNNAWPAFLSLFFYLLPSNNFLDYMALQRIVAEIISVITIIPMYFLCRKFFGKFYSVIGSSLFILEPRLIINSTLGITESLFFLVGISSLTFFLSKNIKIIYLSFLAAGLFALVRYEGLLLIIPLSIIFFIRFGRNRKSIIRYSIAIGIFILVLLPMMVIRIETVGSDGIVSHLVYGANWHSYTAEYPESDEIYYFQVFSTAIKNLVMYTGWILIPMYIWIIPLSIFFILYKKEYKNRDYKKWLIILYAIFMIISPLYAYSREYQETRYLYFLFPVFSLMSFYVIREFEKWIPNKKLLTIILLSFMIVVTIIYLEFKGPNFDELRERKEIGLLIAESASGINLFSNEHYVKITYMDRDDFPILSSKLTEMPKIIPSIGIDSLEKYVEINQKQGLSHLVIENEKSGQPEFLKKLFLESEKIPYLIKEFDSKDLGYSYHVKIFRIDYKEFYSRK